MKAVVFREAKRPMQVEDMPTPSVGDTDVLVGIKAAGICHSDLHTIPWLYRVAKVPMVLGHEGYYPVIRECAVTLKTTPEAARHTYI